MLAVHWFRRDLRINDNMALSHALSGEFQVLPLFIFDKHILDGLPADDARISFIHGELTKINTTLGEHASGVLIKHGDPLAVWKEIVQQYDVAEVCFNRDYEPYALKRDQAVSTFLQDEGIRVRSFKDQLVFEPGEVLKDDGQPYTIFTPFRNKWMKLFMEKGLARLPSGRRTDYYHFNADMPALVDLGFTQSAIKVPAPELAAISNYAATRDLPAIGGTTRLGPHLRFGTLGIRELAGELGPDDTTFLNELVWREFFMHILWHYPRVVDQSFRTQYDAIPWRNDEAEFEKWCGGFTGYPLVDAGMRQLNQTGFMHNRIRMVVASFLCKHLLIDWRWGEAYFASILLDYELASNNGNWQWAAGTGCDAAPYFRVFNPYEQQKKFDPGMEYVKRWVPEIGTDAYPPPIVDHKFARNRAIQTYKSGFS